jgi:hypothetical protein
MENSKSKPWQRQWPLAKGKGLAGPLEENLEMESLRKRLAKAEEELEIKKKRRRISHQSGSGEIRLDRENED